MAEFFKREVFALLLGEELISEALVEKIAGWRHSGFSVHGKVKASTSEEAERVGNFVAAKPPPPRIASQGLLMAVETGAE